MWIVFLLYSLTPSISEVCFVRVDSLLRRDVVRVVPATSQISCNIRCVGTPGCDSCMYYEATSRCVLLTPSRSPPPGQCPVAYTCYEKRMTGCPVKTGPAVDRGYAPGVCSTPPDQRPAPVPGVKQVCGVPPGPSPETRVLDAILHDGSRMVLENDYSSFVVWHPFMGSWVYNLKGLEIFFKSASCVHPPLNALADVCKCGAIPAEQNLPLGTSEHPTAKPILLANPVCGSLRLQAYYKRSKKNNGDVQEVMASAGHIYYCAMGEWMNIDSSPRYNEFTVHAVTCLSN